MSPRLADLPTVVAALSEPDAFREMLDGLADGVYLVDRGRRILFWNAACERISGFSAAEVTGRRCFDNILRHVDDEGTRLCFGLCPLARTMRDGQPRLADVFLHHKDGHRVPVTVRTAPIQDAEGKVIGAIELFTDASRLAASEERMAELEALALTDPLTGLPNRRYLEVALGSRLVEARRHGRSLGVAFADIDFFKKVNDCHGHEAGDRVLQMVARTLDANLGGPGVVARFGGEEFVLLVPDTDLDSLRALCERLLVMVRTSGLDGDGPDEVAVTISMGAVVAGRREGAEHVLRRADELLYRSKREGRDRVSIQAGPAGG